VIKLQKVKTHIVSVIVLVKTFFRLHYSRKYLLTALSKPVLVNRVHNSKFPAVYHCDGVYRMLVIQNQQNCFTPVFFRLWPKKIKSFRWECL